MTETTEWLGGAAVLGVVAGLWGRIKALAWRAASLLIVRVRIEDDAGIAVAYRCWTEFRRSPFGERRYGAFTDFVRPLDRYQAIGFEQAGTDPLLFWKGWRPLLLAWGGAGSGTMPGNGDGSVLSASLSVTFIRGMFDVDVFIAECIDRLNDHRHKGTRASRFGVERRCGDGPRRFARYGGGETTASRGSGSDGPCEVEEKRSSPDRRLLRWRREDVGADDGGADPWEALSFPPEVEGLVEEARRWLASESWYRAKRIPWRRGWLLYGMPGSGKTSLARAIAQELDLPVIAFDLASFGNEDFIREWRRLLNRVPCMVLLEDIDAVFDGRENRLGDEGGGLTFDCLLNCLSGIEAADGVLVVVTTNRVASLDDALGKPDGRGLSTRPGRIDRVLELGPLDEDCRRRLARRILADCPEAVDATVAEGDGDSGAQFQDRCARKALAAYWLSAGRNSETKDRLLEASERP